MTNYIPQIKSGDLLLAPISKSDLEEIRTLRNANKDFFLNTSEITRSQQLMWYQNYKKDKKDIVFASKYHSKLIGMSSLYRICKEDNTCEFGRLALSPNIKGRGFGKSILIATCFAGFEVLKMHKIKLEVLNSNLKAYNLYVKVGFKVVEKNKIITRMQLEKENMVEVCNDIYSGIKTEIQS